MMDLQSLTPIVLYDNRCYLCTKFASIVSLLAGGRFSLIGHYTNIGEKIREQILDSSALEMFWFIDGKTAYGGRAALAALVRSLFSAKARKPVNSVDFAACDTGCKTVKAVFVRSASLLTHSRKITIQ
ncbi:conserved hypothetical protein [Candidatus Nitrosotenuis uzonensis]|uniref:DUF393 domain-containing protein n=2 Tax=Candidatus Nitrosotenuis uzonensis TaxID=1407055 RepID=V6AUL0_9ARCH|nr:conserved hypothetical protein [Candidatus Nitrosotenuis uzonensis]